ncbi:hypothetical protein C0Q70_08920 [Pomacea canaliculata]|uniref:NADP-dependent oxidoreductase domain-containing protein n=1 Tax=Pomacea canaliculata TaxID=400727 RepID=A0A2T7P8B2_POMCA|nr:hypothetical protein C0Q70_08920 [Pomacea canaliculata]
MHKILTVGTFKIRGQDIVHEVLKTAIEAGYRSFDTASVYKNEVDIGRSLQILLPEHGLTREDIFLTSKLAPGDQGSGSCRKACLQSIAHLQCSYLDLFLIHWPGTRKLRPEDSRNKQNRLNSYRDMEQLLREGTVKAIGVSNFTRNHLEELLAETSVVPAVLQNEFHPHLHQKELLEWCKLKGIHFQAYSSLGTSDSHKLLSDPVVLEVAAGTSQTPAQVLLRWAVQQDVGVLPKSTSPKHLRENCDIFSFKLSSDDMLRLSSIHSGTHYCWNPELVA